MDSRYSAAIPHQAKKLPLDDYQNRYIQKTPYILHPTSLSFKYGSTEPLKANHYLNLQAKFNSVPLIKWNSPPKFSIDCDWQVAFGEESEEKVTQMHREMHVVEAIYPHCPFEPLEICNVEDDSTIPNIPIIPIEELLESEAAGAPSTTAHSKPPDNINTHYNLLAASGEDVVADAALVALTALTKSQEMGNLIDKDLLIQVLTNPQLIEKLTSKTGNKPTSGPPVNNLAKPVTTPVPLASSKPDLVKIKRLINEYGPPDKTGEDPILLSSPPSNFPFKDKNYYVTLINEHDKRKDSSEYSSKYENPCTFFNSPRGCRRGSACLYKHVFSDQIGSKRRRL